MDRLCSLCHLNQRMGTCRKAPETGWSKARDKKGPGQKGTKNVIKLVVVSNNHSFDACHLGGADTTGKRNSNAL